MTTEERIENLQLVTRNLLEIAKMLDKRLSSLEALVKDLSELVLKLTEMIDK